jgi:hypothetical protein
LATAQGQTAGLQTDKSNLIDAAQSKEDGMNAAQEKYTCPRPLGAVTRP